MPTATLVRPARVEELSATLRDSAGAVQVHGAGTKLSSTGFPEPPDVVIDTTGLDQIVEHAAGDLVVTARAGVPLAALQDAVRSANQWLALDPPEADATVGGVVAAAASGPRRLLYGTPRDLLIGITVVLADGTVAKSGGKVVKNVAGYDLGKLFTGSFGTLGVIAQCTFRLHPLPPARRAVRIETTDPAAAARKVMATGAVPSAMEYDGASLTVLIESIELAAAAQAEAITAAVGGEISDQAPEGFGAHPWQAPTLLPIGLKVTHRLGALDPALRSIKRRFPEPCVAASVGSGVVRVGTDDLDVKLLDELRRDVASYDGQVRVVHAPAEIGAGLDVWGPARGIDVMRRIKAQFDPDNRMMPGTFVGGI